MNDSDWKNTIGAASYAKMSATVKDPKWYEEVGASAHRRKVENTDQTARVAEILKTKSDPVWIENNYKQCSNCGRMFYPGAPYSSHIKKCK
jgi:uncharacterized protein with PIN domain